MMTSVVSTYCETVAHDRAVKPLSLTATS